MQKNKRNSPRPRVRLGEMGSMKTSHRVAEKLPKKTRKKKWTVIPSPPIAQQWFDGDASDDDAQGIARIPKTLPSHITFTPGIPSDRRFTIPFSQSQLGLVGTWRLYSSYLGSENRGIWI